ncbi:MAG: YgjV family protein [Clostridia bacterium]|nr:YgjV family protein [Clostridia bacterium]
MMYVLSQVLVVLSDVLFIISTMCKSKKRVLFYLILSTILFASHYMCLSAWTGAIIGIIELVYLIIMFCLEIKDKTKFNALATSITIVATILCSILTWAGWISVLPMIAMVIYLTCMIFRNLVIVKTGTFIRLALNGIYMLILASYFGAGLTIAIIIFNIIGIIRDSNRTEMKGKE